MRPAGSNTICRTRSDEVESARARRFQRKRTDSTDEICCSDRSSCSRACCNIGQLVRPVRSTACRNITSTSMPQRRACASLGRRHARSERCPCHRTSIQRTHEPVGANRGYRCSCDRTSTMPTGRRRHAALLVALLRMRVSLPTSTSAQRRSFPGQAGRQRHGLRLLSDRHMCCERTLQRCADGRASSAAASNETDWV